MLQERDEAVERVVAVEVLHLLAAEGVHQAAIQELLAASDVWRAYKDQQHDLFLPAASDKEARLILSTFLQVLVGCGMQGMHLRTSVTLWGAVSACAELQGCMAMNT